MRHFIVYAFTIDFAQEQLCLASSKDSNNAHDEGESRISRTRPHNEHLIGKSVFIVEHRFRGYYGMIYYTIPTLELFGVRLNATGKIVHLPESVLIDLQ